MNYKFDYQQFSNFPSLTSRVAVSTIGTAIREEVMPMELIALFSLLVAATTLMIEIIKLWRNHNNH
jgi:hypothetical protein